MVSEPRFPGKSDDGYYFDHTVATYLTNYCLTLSLLLFTFILVKKKIFSPSKWFDYQRNQACGWYILFTSLMFLSEGILHQFYSYDDPLKNTFHEDLHDGYYVTNMFLGFYGAFANMFYFYSIQTTSIFFFFF
jgi:hypothetical protein